MTNTIQTYLLDGVEPDVKVGCISAVMDGRCYISSSSFFESNALLSGDALFSRKTLEPAIEALLEAHRKQVLLEAAEHCEKKADTHGWNYNLPSIGLELGSDFRRMALEPTGVDKGEKD
jgi:hypothetical protein